MKRFILVLLAICLLLTGCAGTNNCDEALEKRVEALEAENVSLKEKVESLENTVEEYKDKKQEASTNVANIEQTEATNPMEFIEEVEETIVQQNDSNEKNTADNTEELISVLERQVDSNNYADWLEVADCEFVTEDILIKLAEKVATIRMNSNYTSINNERKEWAVKITKKIVENEKTTAKVLGMLIDSKIFAVWDEVAATSKHDEASLIKLAEKVATIQMNSNDTSINNKRKEWAVKITKKIVENEKTTAKVLGMLIDSKIFAVWDEVAATSKHDEASLIKLAEKVATVAFDSSYISTNNTRKDWVFKIAQKIVENEKTTARVLEKLMNTTYMPVWEQIAASSHNDEASLVKLAKRVETIKLNSLYTSTNNERKDWALKITQKIVDNESFSGKVATALAASEISEVRHIAHENLESLNG